MFYVIEHYDKFKDECTNEDKQKLTFSICRVVPFLTSSALMETEGLVDKFTIKSHKGFENANIFNDLKFLQKVTALPQPEFSSKLQYAKITTEEVDYLLEDMVGSLKPILELELDDKKEEGIKQEERKRFKDVNNYKHIFSIAAHYRVDQRSGDAIKNLDNAIKFLHENLTDYSSEQKLCLILRVLTIVGEFSTQKIFGLRTRLDNPELDLELQVIKDLANQIVKPEKYYANLDSDKIKSLNFNVIKSDLEKISKDLKDALYDANDKKASYDDRLNYYITHTSTKSYLSEELIQNLKSFTQNFPEIDDKKRDDLYTLFSSGKSNIKYIGAITDTAKVAINDKIQFNEKMKQIKDQKENLMDKLKKYETGKPVSRLQSIENLLTNITKKSSTTIIKAVDTAKNALTRLDNFIRNACSTLSSDDNPCSTLPEVSSDDNPIQLNYETCDCEENLLNISFLIGGTPYCFPISLLPQKVEIIKATCKHVNDYMSSQNTKYILVPKTFLGIEKEPITYVKFNVEELSNCINNNTDEFVNHFIEYGKYCKLYQYFLESCNRLILDFYLQVTYNLLKDIKEDFDFINKEEYRALRNALRHFEDNLDVMEVETPIEQICTHYAVKYIRDYKHVIKNM